MLGQLGRSDLDRLPLEADWAAKTTLYARPVHRAHKENLQVLRSTERR